MDKVSIFFEVIAGIDFFTPKQSKGTLFLTLFKAKFKNIPGAVGNF